MALLFLLCAAGTATARQKADETPKAKVQELTLDEFRRRVYDLSSDPDEQRYLGDKPAVIDFYASWCGPCRQMEPVVAAAAVEYDGRIVVYKVNIDREPEVAAAFGIRSIPAFLFVPLEGMPRMQVGAMPAERFRALIEQVLLK